MTAADRRIAVAQERYRDRYLSLVKNVEEGKVDCGQDAGYFRRFMVYRYRMGRLPDGPLWQGTCSVVKVLDTKPAGFTVSAMY